MATHNQTRTIIGIDEHGKPEPRVHFNPDKHGYWPGTYEHALQVQRNRRTIVEAYPVDHRFGKVVEVSNGDDDGQPPLRYG